MGYDRSYNTIVMLVIGLKLGNRMLIIYSKENSPVEAILHQLVVDKTVFACSVP